MDQIVSTMESITANARRIADIVGVIDSIAFQTDLLALNAAVVTQGAQASSSIQWQVKNLWKRLDCFGERSHQ